MTSSGASPHRAGAAPGLCDGLRLELDGLRAQGLYRSRRALETAQGAHVSIAGVRYLSFASNDYLGLAADARIVAALREGAERHGAGAGASHLLYGHHRAHEEAERELAQFVGYPRALLFSTGYMANLGVVSAVCGRGDEIFADRLNHASLNDAMLLARARFRRYPHGDIECLGRWLSASRARRKIVLTDAVFSMDGDIAPLPALLDLCERYDALLVLDDAHGFGVLGAQGAGSLSHFGLTSERVVYMGTLGKAAGLFGAFVAASALVIDHLINRARTYIYTTAAPPLLAHALLTSLALMRDEGWRRSRLAQCAGLLDAARNDLPGDLLPSRTPIQPLVLGTAESAVRMAEHLARAGLLVPAVRPPTVPAGSARLRISLSAGHSEEDIERLLAALRSAAP